MSKSTSALRCTQYLQSFHLVQGIYISATAMKHYGSLTALNTGIGILPHTHPNL